MNQLEDLKHELVHAYTYQAKSLIRFLFMYLVARKKQTTTIVYLLGLPASGKSYIAEQLVAYFKTEGYSADATSTDDYNKGTRDDRRKIIQETSDPLKEKDLDLLRSSIDSLKKSSTGTIDLPQKYDTHTGLALAQGMRQIPANIDFLIVEGNFYVGGEDIFIYVHIDESIRLELEYLRNIEEGRSDSKEEVLKLFKERHASQDIPHTLPHMKKAVLYVESLPVVEDNTIKDWSYNVWEHENKEHI